VWTPGRRSRDAFAMMTWLATTGGRNEIGRARGPTTRAHSPEIARAYTGNSQQLRRVTMRGILILLAAVSGPPPPSTSSFTCASDARRRAIVHQRVPPGGVGRRLSS